MKIAFLIRSLNVGGAERQLINLAIGLYKKGHSVNVLVFYKGGLLEKELENKGIKVEGLGKKNRYDLSFLKNLILFLKKEKPDILHSYLVECNITSAIIKPLFPSMKIVWGIRASNMDLSYYDWFCRVSFKLQCFLSRFADCIIFNSNASLDYHIACGFSKKNIVVIPNGIDIERFYPDKDKRKNLREEWGIKEDEKLIGLVARLDPMKDHQTFLKAISLLKQNKLKFVCVGDGPLKNKLEDLGKKLGLEHYLRWVGGRDDMASVYNALDIACSSSSFGEGFSNTIGEAMACGIPCVVTDVGDSALIVGDTGIVVSPRNPQGLANGLKRMIKQLQDQPLLGENARHRIISLFSIDKLIERTEGVLANS